MNREELKRAIYENLCAADNQDVPLEEYPDRILAVIESRAALQAAPEREAETASVAWLHRPDELRRMKAVFERDRTIVADTVKTITKAIAAREWLRLGRGSYEWNDVRWKDEFGAAFDEILHALEPLKTLAADLSDCPMLPADIAQARATPPASATAKQFNAMLRAASEIGRAMPTSATVEAATIEVKPAVYDDGRTRYDVVLNGEWISRFDTKGTANGMQARLQKALAAQPAQQAEAQGGAPSGPG